jgi:hypothetical protein
MASTLIEAARHTVVELGDSAYLIIEVSNAAARLMRVGLYAGGEWCICRANDYFDVPWAVLQFCGKHGGAEYELHDSLEQFVEQKWGADRVAAAISLMGPFS